MESRGREAQAKNHSKQEVKAIAVGTFNHKDHRFDRIL